MNIRWWLLRKAREMKAKSDAAEKAANREYYTDKYGQPRVVRKFEYKNFGQKQNLLAFATLASFLAAFTMGKMADSYAYDQFKILSKSPPPASEQFISLVRENEKLPPVTNRIDGRYLYRIDYEQGHTLHGDISFNSDSTVYKNILIGESMSMRGIADYTIVGRVLKYSGVQGDMFLFSEYGDIIEQRDKGELVFLYEDGKSLHLSELGSSHTVKPMIVNDGRSLLQIILSAHYTAQLQLLFLLAGILLTLYIITMILMQVKDNIVTKKTKDHFQA